MKKNFLIMTIGLPYSGKTKWRNELMDSWPVVCPDDIRFALHGQRYIQEAENFVWEIARIMAKSLFLSGHKTVILDACNVTANRRDFWEDNLWMRKYIVMDIHKDVCINRALKNRDEYITPIIERMSDSLEFDGIFYSSMGTHPMADHIEMPTGKQIYHKGRAPETD